MSAHAFLGERLLRCDAGGFAIEELRPTVPADQVAEHAHAHAHVVLVLDGGYISRARGMDAVQTGPAVVFNPAGTEHRDRFATTHGRFLAVGIGDGVDCAATRTREPLRLDTHAVLAAAKLRTLAAHADDAATRLDIEGWALRLLACLPWAGADRPGRPRWLDRALATLHDAGDGGPGLVALAAEAGVHPVYFARAFRRHVGCTPGAFLRRARLRRALALLRGRDPVTLADVAASAGFYDQSHLHREVRAASGLGVAALRRALAAG